ncbi:MAG: hypothetical protein QG657_5543, partial [Acidobacteriota bacterium]|nr:hypothetical protein [Acidobacteriota bacterium]
EEKEYYPLTSVQKRLFALHRFESSSTVYNVSSIKLLEGPLDKNQVEYAFKTIVKRHEVFRTSFITLAGDAIQRIHKAGDILFEVTYIETVSNPDESETRNLINRCIKPFDLGKAPLLRVILLKLSANKHILMYDTHHIIADGNSKGILAREFIELYNGETLPGLKAQYKDFSVWQQSERVQAIIKRQELYWSKEFKGEIPTLHLPTDYPRPAQKNYEGSSLPFKIAQKETTALKTLALKTNNTLFTVLLAIYNVLLAKISRQEDITIGIPAAGRNHRGLDNMIGMFVNTLALRNFPTQEMPFEDFLKQVKQRTLDVFENQDYPFEDLVNKVVKHRDLGRNPIFDVFFSFNYPGISREVEENFSDEGFSALEIKSYEGEAEFSMFDMFLSGLEMEGELLLGFTYAAKLFKKETMERFAGYCREIVSAIIENNRVKLKDIKISHDLGMAGSKMLLDKDTENDFGF